jgi:hypothetical protein
MKFLNIIFVSLSMQSCHQTRGGIIGLTVSSSSPVIIPEIELINVIFIQSCKEK